MLQPGTATQYRDGTLAGIVSPVARTRAAAEVGVPSAPLAAERALDEVLADSFPASDPPSWNPGTVRPTPVESPAAASHDAVAERRRQTAINAERAELAQPGHSDRTFMQGLLSLAGATGIALLVPVAVLLIGLPVVLLIRGLLEAVGWLLGLVSI